MIIGIADKSDLLVMAIFGSISSRWACEELQRYHFAETAKECGLGASIEDLLEMFLTRVEKGNAKVHASLPAGFSKNVATAIFAGIRRNLKVLKAT